MQGPDRQFSDTQRPIPGIPELQPPGTPAKHSPAAQAVARGYRPVGVLPMHVGNEYRDSPAASRYHSHEGVNKPKNYVDVVAVRSLLSKPAPQPYDDVNDHHNYDQLYDDEHDGYDPDRSSPATQSATKAQYQNQPGGDDYDMHSEPRQPQAQPQQAVLLGAGGVKVGRRGRYDPAAAAASEAAAAAARVQNSRPAARQYDSQDRPEIEYESMPRHQQQLPQQQLPQQQQRQRQQQQQQLLGGSGTPTGRRGHYDPQVRNVRGRERKRVRERENANGSLPSGVLSQHCSGSCILSNYRMNRNCMKECRGRGSRP
jgi:hypothetical protein